MNEEIEYLISMANLMKPYDYQQTTMELVMMTRLPDEGD